MQFMEKAVLENLPPRQTFQRLWQIWVIGFCRSDVILYDVLGDVVCGGFAMPIRGGYARNVFIVTSGEMMSLYAASNIASAVKNFGKRGYAQYSGVILNSGKVENEEVLVKETLKEIGGEIVSVLPRSESVQEAENLGKTVIEALPESAMADAYRKLAAHMIELSAEVENNYDYLAGFSEKAFPDSCMIMNFGEYSDRTFFEKELTFTGCFLSPYSFPRAVQMLKELDLDEFIREVYPLSRGPEAFDEHAGGKCLKILIQCNEDLQD